MTDVTIERGTNDRGMFYEVVLDSTVCLVAQENAHYNPPLPRWQIWEHDPSQNDIDSVRGDWNLQAATEHEALLKLIAEVRKRGYCPLLRITAAVSVEDVERFRDELLTFRRTDEVDADNACALADALENLLAPYVELRYVECSRCGQEFVFAEDDEWDSDDLESTYCGSFCTGCLPAHLEECETCRSDFA